MIFAAGLSPAWQQILEFEEFKPGEVNRARAAHWCASGKVLNVAWAAQSLQARASLLSAIGGPSGEAIRQQIAAQGIFADWIELPDPTRVCTTILAPGLTTELVENCGPVADDVLESFYEKFRIHAEVAEITVLTGSMPMGVPDHYCAMLIRNLTKRTILDIRGPALLQALSFSPFLVKPNRAELAQTSEDPLRSDDELMMAMRGLNQRGAAWVVVSDGPRAVWVTSLEQTFQLVPPACDVVNPIGCGDCLAAGIAVALQASDDVIAAVRYGMGAAAANVSQLLPARINQANVKELAEAVEVREIG